jgi:hypothetical protein
MIKDWIKYEAYRGQIMQTLRSKLSFLTDDIFYDFFSDAYIVGFEKFEKKYNPVISKNEPGFLYEIVKNNIINLLKKDKIANPLSNTNQELDSIKTEGIFDIFNEPDDERFLQVGNLRYDEFLIKFIKNRNTSIPIEDKNIPILSYDYHINFPLLKREAWSFDKPLNLKTLNSLTEKITSDLESANFYDIREPMSIFRLISWVGCSKF